ncbi:MAG: helix-turn-helix transcriptional regulator [Ruminococcaceae bacterium]|nr:helix-turn-helix transcriptional regulator [Oscillospiraceae bacterium]
MNYYEIGQRIRKIRKAHGLSQEELAERINISTTHMSHIETGSTKLSLPVLVDLASVLNVRVDDLLYDSPIAPTGRALEEILTIIDSCTPQEAKVIADVVKATKLSMDKYL